MGLLFALVACDGGAPSPAPPPPTFAPTAAPTATPTPTSTPSAVAIATPFYPSVVFAGRTPWPRPGTTVVTEDDGPIYPSDPETGRGTIGFPVYSGTGIFAHIFVSSTLQLPQPQAGDANLNNLVATMKVPGEGAPCGGALCGATLEPQTSYWVGAGWADTARAFRVENHAVENAAYVVTIPIDAAFVAAYGDPPDRVTVAMQDVYVPGTGTYASLHNYQTGMEDLMYFYADVTTNLYGGWVMAPEATSWSNTPCTGLQTMRVWGLQILDATGWHTPKAADVGLYYSGTCAAPGDSTLGTLPDFSGFTTTFLR